MTRSLYIFDMGNVVIVGIDIIGPIIAKLGLPADEFRADYLRHIIPMMNGTLPTAEYLRHVAERFDVEVREDFLATCFRPAFNDGMVDLLNRLRSAGRRVVCGTNTYDSHHRYLLEHGFYRYFDTVYSSHRMGINKPDPLFWSRILESEGVAAERTFFIDDYLENVEGARSLGINAFHYTPGMPMEEVLGFCRI